MTARLAPSLKFREFDQDGSPLSGGRLYVYEAGTTTLAHSFKDSTGVDLNTNPVILDADGRADLWLGGGSYKLILKDAADVTIWSVDNVVTESQESFAESSIDVASSTTLTTDLRDSIINCTSALGLTLPTAVDDGFRYLINNQSSGEVVIAPSGADNIEGESTTTIPAKGSAMIAWSGGSWRSLFDSIGSDVDTIKNTLSLGSVSEMSVEALRDLITGYATPIGTWHWYAGDVAPDNYLVMDGSEIGRIEYADLYAITGDAFGAGDGINTFNLPNQLDRMARASGSNAVGDLRETDILTMNVSTHIGGGRSGSISITPDGVSKEVTELNTPGDGSGHFQRFRMTEGEHPAPDALTYLPIIKAKYPTIGES